MIKSICILGGGTSGYLTAAYLRNTIPEAVKITLIESSKVGIIGVGEGTQPYTTEFLRKCGLQPIDWMKKAHATYKLGVEFTGWSDQPYFVDNDDYGSFVLGPEIPTFNYWMTKSKKEFFDFVQSYRLAKANKSPKINHAMDFTHGFITPSWDAVHFDAHKIGESIKELIKEKIEIVDTEIVEVDTFEQGIKCLRDEAGIEYSADLYIDCSGFKSLLLGKTLGVRFLDETDNLPCNSAVAIPTQYKNPKEECHPYTKATTMKHGWRWTIPTYERIGNGYVYSDKYCSKEKAEEELREAIGEHEAEARHLQMRIGTHEGIAHDNVVAIGLSAGFVEPLEATGITFTTKAVEFLVESLRYSDGVWTPQNLNFINTEWLKMYYEIRDFIFTHYKFASRKDTQFWRDVTSKELPDTAKQRLDRFVPGPKDSMFIPGITSMFHTGQWFEMLYGSDFYGKSLAFLSDDYIKYAESYIDTENYRIERMMRDLDNHYDYLTKWYKNI